eukprot:g13312.t1
MLVAAQAPSTAVVLVAHRSRARLESELCHLTDRQAPLLALAAEPFAPAPERRFTEGVWSWEGGNRNGGDEDHDDLALVPRELWRSAEPSLDVCLKFSHQLASKGVFPAIDLDVLNVTFGPTYQPAVLRQLRHELQRLLQRSARLREKLATGRDLGFQAELEEVDTLGSDTVARSLLAQQHVPKSLREVVVLTCASVVFYFPHQKPSSSSIQQFQSEIDLDDEEARKLLQDLGEALVAQRLELTLTRPRLMELINGPIIGKAAQLDGKAGVIQCLYEEGGSLEHLGAEAWAKALLIDDDISELVWARDIGMQTFAAPPQGGLQEDDFDELFRALGLEGDDEQRDMDPTTPLAQPRNRRSRRPVKLEDIAFEEEEIRSLWAQGLVGQSLNLPTTCAQKHYDKDEVAPKLIDHYDITEELGQGSFGTAYVGHYRSSSLQCAVKLLDREHVGQPLGLGQHARVLIKNSLSALAHIHSVCDVGIIHRDVKPENLRFRSKDPKSELVLVDFGLCCPATDVERRTIVGSLLYVAPEVFSRKYGTKADLWSIGVELEGLPDALSLLQGLLVVTPEERLSAAEALRGPWLGVQHPAKGQRSRRRDMFKSQKCDTDVFMQAVTHGMNTLRCPSINRDAHEMRL